ncbi:hypothetical protein AB6A40_000162 [Gnathostoma spinigerum]|uniref:Uncharacterized protein n=1 Tax=Gnathostoma spinigerum TaxID=75299 RepID=A0ABD6E9Q9_9BILA
MKLRVLCLLVVSFTVSQTYGYGIYSNYSCCYLNLCRCSTGYNPYYPYFNPSPYPYPYPNPYPYIYPYPYPYPYPILTTIRPTIILGPCVNGLCPSGFTCQNATNICTGTI